jgi:serine/threonine-protein kinase HipA
VKLWFGEPALVDRLVAWLYGVPVLTLKPSDNFRFSLDWTSAAAERWGLGSRILSVSLPLGVRLPARDDTGLNFFENLLPEGPALDTMAKLAKVSRADTYGMLAAFGRDCAGAIVMLPDGEVPPEPGEQTNTPLTADELAKAIRNLGTNPLGADPERGFQPSLPGYTRGSSLWADDDDDGTWQTVASECVLVAHSQAAVDCSAAVAALPGCPEPSSQFISEAHLAVAMNFASPCAFTS